MCVLHDRVHGCSWVEERELDMANVEVADGNDILQKGHAVHHVLRVARPHGSIDNAQDKPQLPWA